MSDIKLLFGVNLHFPALQPNPTALSTASRANARYGTVPLSP
jgi:hypothetical protein